MSVYEDRKPALEEYEFRMGLERGRLAVTLDLLFGNDLPSEGFIEFPGRIRGQNPNRHRTEAPCTKLTYEMLYQQRSKALPLCRLEEINRV